MRSVLLSQQNFEVCPYIKIIACLKEIEFQSENPGIQTWSLQFSKFPKFPKFPKLL
jgi:hypothetical protein